ncbi:MAG: amino acid permease [Acidimicrobiales bacterium]
MSVEAKTPAWLKPKAAPSGMMPDLPESRSYRWKKFLLGPPLVSKKLEGERLSKPVALAVLSSDVMSSSAYSTESMLRILIPVAGLGAFALVAPLTALLLVVLAVVCLCYRQVVKAYPVAGGSYVVSRENFGYNVAQIPGAALLCSYTLTVAVSIAAGVDAIISAFPALSPYPIELSVFCVVMLTFGNLRGIKEAGRVFAVPTYWFLASMALLLAFALVRYGKNGHLDHIAGGPGQLHLGAMGGGLLFGAGLFIVLRGFANGGSAMTGMEAISNAVTVFRDPQVQNARRTLVFMASIIGTLFLGVSALAGLTHAPVYVSGTPTVLSEIGRQVFGGSSLAAVPYYSLQFSTALILILGANTSYNGFPLLVSFIAEDAFLPRPLTTRGHRLVFSNGIFLLTVVSLVLLVGSGAKVANLIPLYACTVFTGFTMAGAGMFRYFLRAQGPRKKGSLFVAGMAFVCSAVVTLIFVVTEFTHGAWLVVVVIPLLVATLAWTHRRYQAERAVLAEDAAVAASEAPVLPNHVVIVLVDRLDLATARALQLARSLASGSELRAVHFVLDADRAARLSRAWTRLGLESVPLDVVECSDRRLVRAAAEMAADLAKDQQTEVLLVLPRRAYSGVLNRILHDNTAERIVAAVSQIPHVSATVAPFDVGGRMRQRAKVLAGHVTRSIGVAPGQSLGGDTGGPLGGDGAEHLKRDGGGAGSDRAATGREVAPADGTTAPGRAPDAGVRPGDVPGEGEEPSSSSALPSPARTDGGDPVLGGAQHRQRVRLTGRVHSVRVQPWEGVPTFELSLVGAGGTMTVVFLGRRSVPGIAPETILTVEGTVGTYQGRLAMLNPEYEIRPPDDEDAPEEADG